jgi:hypothetical protein
MNKDIYEYMLYFCDDYTIVNAILANGAMYKKSEEVYERLMKKKYPGCEKWKKKGKSWERYFVKFSSFVAILKSRFYIPYFEGLNPEKFYLEVRDRCNQDVFIYLTHEAIKAGNLKIVKEFSKKLRPDCFQGCIATAIKVGSLEILKHFVEQSTEGINYLTAEAIYWNRMDIVYYLLEKEANNFDLFLMEAAASSNFPLVKLFISKGANPRSALDHVVDPEIEKYLRAF